MHVKPAPALHCQRATYEYLAENQQYLLWKMMSGYSADGIEMPLQFTWLKGSLYTPDLLAGLAAGVLTVTHGHLNHGLSVVVT
jgi:hypothetical protein